MSEGPSGSFFSGPPHRRSAGIAALLLAAAAGDAAAQNLNLLDMSIEELSRIQVTTVSRQVESLQDAAASVYVITREEILRSGVRSIPEALRLAPGVEVARNGASSWTISMRGFSSDLSNKLLVLIDGRSVYSPLYAGVFWDVQDTLLQDIERIEVIAGPGGTLWGANAVNGIINIITRPAGETVGGFLEAGGGSEQEAFAALRYGAPLGRDGAARVYLKSFERDASRPLGGGTGVDDWEMGQAGFRADWTAPNQDGFTLQGDLYRGEAGARVRPDDFALGTVPPELPGTVDLAGGNLLARWTRQLAREGSLRLQAYYDYTERDIPGTYHERRHTVDLDFQHQLPVLGVHELIWGAGFRSTGDELDNTRFAVFTPDERRDNTWSLFLQDRIALRPDRMFLTVGSKIENNDYTGMEYQPNLRFAWLLTPSQTLWAAVSRAVRIPARLNEDLELFAPVAVPGIDMTVLANVSGDRDFESEELIAYEFGYRISPRDDLSLDLALYRHDYDELMTNETLAPEVVPGPPSYLRIPVLQGNGIRGETYGGTLAANWQPSSRLRLEFQYSRIEFDLDLKPGSNDTNSLTVAGNSPRNQTAVQAYLEMPANLSLFAGLRYVDELSSMNVPAYTALDLSLDWRPTENLAASLSARNLNDPRHPEFGEGNEIERSAWLRLSWTF